MILIFEVKCRHYRHISKLDHIDKGENDKHKYLAGIRHQKQRRARCNNSRTYDHHVSVGKNPLPVYKGSHHRLCQCRRDIGHCQKNTYLGIGKSPVQQIHRRIGVHRAKGHKVCDIYKCIS